MQFYRAHWILRYIEDEQMKKNNNLHYVLIILTVSLLISGCGDNKHLNDTKKFIEQTRQAELQTDNHQVSGAMPALPKPVKYESDESNSSNDGNNIANPKNLANPVLMYPLKSLQFIGTLTKDNRIYAYVMTPDGSVYLLKVGDFIGNKSGKIMKIDSNHVEINEGSESSDEKKSSEQIVVMELKD